MNKKGFTLIELLVVIAVIGILTTIVIVSLSGARVKTKNTAILEDLHGIRTLIETITGASGNYTGICDEFEDGGELDFLPSSIESKGGSWVGCADGVDSYAVTVNLVNNFALLDRFVNIALAVSLPPVYEEPVQNGIHSNEPLLLTINNLYYIREQIGNSGTFYLPKYYCIGASQANELEENTFREGYLYLLPASGCGSYTSTSDEVMSSYNIATGPQH